MPQDLSAVAWPLRTARLTVRPATTDDVEATWRFRRLPQVNHWITRAPSTLADYEQQFREPARLAKTLVVELGEEVVGDLMLQVEDAWSQGEVADQARGVQAELGWALHPDHCGHGYATEAVRALVRLCFEDLGLRRVSAKWALPPSTIMSPGSIWAASCSITASVALPAMTMMIALRGRFREATNSSIESAGRNAPSPPCSPGGTSWWARGWPTTPVPSPWPAAPSWWPSTSPAGPPSSGSSRPICSPA